MQPSPRQLAALLQEKHLRPSHQRLKVLEYLHREDTHPTVDEIYRALAPELPSLSRATVYNTLHTFIKAGLICAVGIDEGEMRYDHSVAFHGHFKCTSCGAIHNFGIDTGSLSVSGLDNFTILEKSVYFKGLCPACSQPQATKGES